MIVAEGGETKSLRIDDVYLILGVMKNFINSVSQITHSGKYVLFCPNDVKVLDTVKDVEADVVFSGTRKGSLFVMSAAESYIKRTTQSDTVAVWHARLGHIGYQMLQTNLL